MIFFTILGHIEFFLIHKIFILFDDNGLIVHPKVHLTLENAFLMRTNFYATECTMHGSLMSEYYLNDPGQCQYFRRLLVWDL